MSSSISANGTGSEAPEDTATADLVRVCRAALHSQDEAAALADLRRHARSIAARLGEEAICEALAVDPPGSVSNERIADVFEILAQFEPGAFPPEEVDRALLAANLDDEKEIGLAFKEQLLLDLGPVLTNLAVYFAATPRVSRKEERRLSQTASARAALPEAGGLLACGLTPLSVFYATRNVQSLARRLRAADAQGRDSLTLAPLRRLSAVDDAHVPFSERVAREVVQVSRCSEEAALALVNWLIEVSKVKPLVFAGYRAEPEGAGVRLVPYEDHSDKPLSERWQEPRSNQAERAQQPAADAPGRPRH